LIRKTDKIDSLVIGWPTGDVDVFENPGANKHWIAEEGGDIKEFESSARNNNIKWME